MPLLLFLVAVLLFTALGGIHSRPSAANPNLNLNDDVYVWQRSWNPALRAALCHSSGSVRAWRILAAESDAPGKLARIAIDSALLRSIGKSVIAVVRIDGHADRLSTTLAGQVASVASDWRNLQLPLSGLEIDYDCPAGRLPLYRDFLLQLRSAMPPHLRLSITALPSWMGARQLPALLSAVDESVLQVHSVVSSRQTLFNREQALAWAQAWASLSPVPFRLALPTYWSRLTWDSAGRIEAIESETDRHGTGFSSRELLVSPQTVAAFLTQLKSASPPHLQGISWFRLPTSLDRRAWSLTTWQAVMLARPLQLSPPTVRLQNDPSSGARNVYLTNQALIDAELPARIDIAAQSCDFADSLPPFTLVRQSGTLRFVRQSAALLHPGQQALVGWVRCSQPQPVITVFP